MPKEITTYKPTFNPAARTLNFGANDGTYANFAAYNGGVPLTLNKILAINNLTSNQFIYNCSDSALGGSLVGQVLTLTYNTSAMSAGDVLQVFYDVDVAATNAALENGGKLASINARDADVDYTGSVTPSTPLVINTEEKGTLGFEASGVWSGSVIVEGSIDGITYRPTTFVALTSGGISNNFSAPTAGQINTVAFDFIRFRSSTIASGSVNILATTSRLVSNVMLDNSLPAGSNTIGKVDVNNFPATQPISATSLPLPTGAATSAGVAAIVTALGSPMQVSGGSVNVSTLPSIPAGSNAIGSVMANAGTNLNTSALAVESGGNLAGINSNTSAINSKLPSLGQGIISTSLPVVLPAISNIATGQVAPTTSATLIANARTGRQSIAIVQNGTTPVYLGTSGVTSSTGILLTGTLGAAISLDYQGAIYAITASGTGSISFVETY